MYLVPYKQHIYGTNTFFQKCQLKPSNSKLTKSGKTLILKEGRVIAWLRTVAKTAQVHNDLCVKNVCQHRTANNLISKGQLGHMLQDCDACALITLSTRQNR